MDKDLYVMVLEEIMKHYEELKLTGKQKSQLENITLKIKHQIERGEK